MTKKEEFLEAWSVAFPGAKSPKQFYEAKEFKQFAELLNRSGPTILRLFREAWHEAEDKESDPSQGLSLLFGEI